MYVPCIMPSMADQKRSRWPVCLNKDLKDREETIFLFPDKVCGARISGITYCFMSEIRSASIAFALFCFYLFAFVFFFVFLVKI